jgi:hypothetical protein
MFNSQFQSIILMQQGDFGSRHEASPVARAPTVDGEAGRYIDGPG